MRVELFDDRYSLFHVPCGMIAYWVPAFFVIYIFYQVIEFAYKKTHGKEEARHYVGDLFEFMAGVACAHFVVLLL